MTVYYIDQIWIIKLSKYLRQMQQNHNYNYQSCNTNEEQKQPHGCGSNDPSLIDSIYLDEEHNQSGRAFADLISELNGAQNQYLPSQVVQNSYPSNHYQAPRE